MKTNQILRHYREIAANEQAMLNSHVAACRNATTDAEVIAYAEVIAKINVRLKEAKEFIRIIELALDAFKS